MSTTLHKFIQTDLQNKVHPINKPAHKVEGMGIFGNRTTLPRSTGFTRKN